MTMKSSPERPARVGKHHAHAYPEGHLELPSRATGPESRDGGQHRRHRREKHYSG